MDAFRLPSIDVYPGQQARDSKTFKVPPLDGSLTMIDMFDWHLENSPNHPIFSYKSPRTSELRTVLWPEAARAIHRCTRYLQACIGEICPNAAPSVIAILGHIDTIRYFTLNMGIIRAGYVAFPISTRNSTIGVATLLSKTNCCCLFVSEDAGMQTLAKGALEILKTEESFRDHPTVNILPLPSFEHLFPGEDGNFQPLPTSDVSSLDAPALILHSSGSTAFPKPITYTHKILVQWTLLLWHGEVDVCGRTLAAHSIPMFHSMGLIMITWAVSCGLVISCFAPLSPPVIPTPDAVLSEAVETKSHYLLCVPAWLEGWSHEKALLPTLANFKGVMFGGAPLNKEVGDFLNSKGVDMMVLFGSTESGSVCRLIMKPETVGTNWDYFELSPHSDIYLKPRKDISDLVFELIVLDSAGHTPCTINCEIDDRPAYATNDLIIRHPTEPKLWKVYGRADDQIILSTGEKTNPSPIEGILMRDSKSRISSALMFGRGRFSNGIILELKEPHVFDPNDLERLAQFRNEIWPLVEEANQLAPAHSHLFKEMILVAKKSKPFEYTPKGTARRHVVVAKYEEEINEAYKAIENAALLERSLPENWSVEENLAFVRGIVRDVLGKAIEDSDDLFQKGCDSLQATWLRNKIQEALRQTAAKLARSIPQNLIYSHPTISKLASSITAITRNGSVEDDTASKVDELNKLVEEFTSDFPVHRPSKPAPNEEVVLLTGSTGSLGTHILAKLIQMHTVKKVFALNRSAPDGTALEERQMETFRDKGIETALLHNGKLTLVECDFGRKMLGLDPKLYDEIRQSVTTIIHNAWMLDFNQVLASFRPMISSVRELVDLALSSPFEIAPTIVFTSSLGATLGLNTECSVPEEPIEDPKVLASVNGYGQSKWIAERILEEAYRTRLLRTVNVRVGQVAGGPNGAWNTAEWFPALLKSSILIRCLPGGEDLISWTPADIAAAAIVDFRLSTEQTLHLNHPKPIKWSSVMGPIAKALGVPIVSYGEWLAKLEETGREVGHGHTIALDNPALKLMDFYRPRTIMDHSNGPREALGFPILNLSKALQVSSTLSLSNLQQIGEEDVGRWLQYWKSKGFL